MMRILMLDNEFPPLGGGMGTVNLAVMKEMATWERGEIDLVTSAIGRHSEMEQFSPSIRIYKVPVRNQNIHHSSNRELITYAVLAYSLAARLHKQNPYDFSLAWSALPAGSVALALRYIYHLPYMVWVSGPDIPGFELRYRKLYPFLAPHIRAIWRQAEPLIAKCKEEVEMIHALEPGLPVEIIPNGVDLENFLPNMEKDLTLPLHVICVARLIERKGQHHLIQAVKILADQGIDLRLTLVGTGDSMQLYQGLCRDARIEAQVIFAGYIPREQVAAWYRSADVFVLPSYNEGMSLAALEAMACGLPVILTHGGGTGGLVDVDKNGYLFDWGDIDTLVRALKLFAFDRSLVCRMGEVSRKKAEEFSWPNIARRFGELFNRHAHCLSD